MLQESLVFIDALATEIGRKMDEISKITLNLLQLLTSLGSISITMKLCALTVLAGSLSVLQDRLENVTLHLQCHNAQIRARALPHPMCYWISVLLSCGLGGGVGGKKCELSSD